MSSKHSDNISNYNGTIEQLAQDICNLKYNVLSELLYEISAKLNYDSIKDFNRKREKLSKKLSIAANFIMLAKNNVDEAWNICEPYMKHEK